MWIFSSCRCFMRVDLIAINLPSILAQISFILYFGKFIACKIISVDLLYSIVLAWLYTVHKQDEKDFKTDSVFRKTLQTKEWSYVVHRCHVAKIVQHLHWVEFLNCSELYAKYVALHCHAEREGVKKMESPSCQSQEGNGVCRAEMVVC